jgi:hypothetical protein
VMTIKFKDAISATACVTKMHGRYFDGRMVSYLQLLLVFVRKAYFLCRYQQGYTQGRNDFNDLDLGFWRIKMRMERRSRDWIISPVGL